MIPQTNADACAECIRATLHQMYKQVMLTSRTEQLIAKLEGSWAYIENNYQPGVLCLLCAQVLEPGRELVVHLNTDPHRLNLSNLTNNDFPVKLYKCFGCSNVYPTLTDVQTGHICTGQSTQEPLTYGTRSPIIVEGAPQYYYPPAKDDAQPRSTRKKPTSSRKALAAARPSNASKASSVAPPSAVSLPQGPHSMSGTSTQKPDLPSQSSTSPHRPASQINPDPRLEVTQSSDGLLPLDAFSLADLDRMWDISAEPRPLRSITHEEMMVLAGTFPADIADLSF